MEIPVSDYRRISVAHKSGAAFDSASAAPRRNDAHGGRSASLQKGGWQQSSTPDARVSRFRSVSLAIVVGGVLLFCLASIALSITGIIGRIPGLSNGSGGSAPAAVHATSGIDRQTAAAPGAIANDAHATGGAVRHDSSANR